MKAITIKKTDINSLRDRAYKIACEHGFHDEELSNEHFLCLVVSELMEAVEADRKGKHADVALFKEWQGNNLPISEETRIRRFKQDFDEFLKGTVEEELADTAIRLLDLAGLRGITIEEFPEEMIYESAELCKRESFTENIYDISTLPSRYDGIYDFPTTINDMLFTVFGFAQYLNIDLMWHIEQKMKYNELRENKHGKRY